MKAIRMKQKGSLPMVFNTIGKLASHLNLTIHEASHILSVKNEYEKIMRKYSIESIEETDDRIIPQHYIDQGFKRIEIPGKHVYIANKEGKIINIANDRELKPLYKGKGYLVVNINGKMKTVHRIIATLFVPNPKRLPLVNHINEDKTDNRAVNLEWCDNKYNCNYGSFKKKCSISDGKPIKIKSFKEGKEIIYQSIKEASRKTGADEKSIRGCINGNRKSAKGFIFSKIK